MSFFQSSLRDLRTRDLRTVDVDLEPSDESLGIVKRPYGRMTISVVRRSFI